MPRRSIHTANAVDYVHERAELSADYAPDESVAVALHNGGEIVLPKVAIAFQPGDEMAALTAMHRATAASEILTRLL